MILSLIRLKPCISGLFLSGKKATYNLYINELISFQQDSDPNQNRCLIFYRNFFGVTFFISGLYVPDPSTVI